MADNNSGRHRAPDGEANTAYIPRISDASPDGVPGGPLAPPVGLGSGAEPAPDVRREQPPAAPADTAILETDESIRRRVAAARTYAEPPPPSGEKPGDDVSTAAAAARRRPAEPQTPLPPGEFDFFASARDDEQPTQAAAPQPSEANGQFASPAPAAQRAQSNGQLASPGQPSPGQNPPVMQAHTPQTAQVPSSQGQPLQGQPLQGQPLQGQPPLAPPAPARSGPMPAQLSPGRPASMPGQPAQAQPAQAQPMSAQPMQAQSAARPATQVYPAVTESPTPAPAQPAPGQPQQFPPTSAQSAGQVQPFTAAAQSPGPAQPFTAAAQSPGPAQPFTAAAQSPGQVQFAAGAQSSGQAQQFPAAGQPGGQAQQFAPAAQSASGQGHPFPPSVIPLAPGQAPRPQVTHTMAPVSPTPQLQPPAATQQLPAPVSAAAARPAIPQTISASANGAGGYGPRNHEPTNGAQSFGSPNGDGALAYGSPNGDGALAYSSPSGDGANGKPGYGSANGHSAPEVNGRAAIPTYAANGSNGHGQPEPARVAGSAYGSPDAAASGGFGPASRGNGSAPSGLNPARRSSEGGYQPGDRPATPTSPGTFGSPTPQSPTAFNGGQGGGHNGGQGGGQPGSPSVPGLRNPAVPGGLLPASTEDVAATRQLPAPDVNGAKVSGLRARPETDFIEQPSGGKGFIDSRQDPSETAIIRTADAPTGLLPSLRKPTKKVGVPGAAAEAAKAAADPDAVLGAVPVTEVRPGLPGDDDEPVEEDGPKRGEKVVKLRPEQTEDGYESVYSKLTRPTLASRIRGGIRVSGELMITFGLIVLLFAGYEVFGNGAKVQSEQDSLNSKLDQDWADPTVGPTKAGPAAPGDSLVGRLYIPKFAKEWVVVNGVLPDNIKYAPGHYPDTAMPGQIGNFSVAGHRIPKIFWRINELKTGDVIGVETRDSWYIYKVYGQEIVKPDAVQVVEPVPDQPGVKATKAVLTLTTCNPKGNNYQRLIVHAQLASQVKRDATKPDAGMPAEMKAKY